jgi:hypothetical protein
MSGWDRAKELTQKNAGGIFIRLQNDGEKFVGSFRGDPFPREMHWVGEEYVECARKGCEQCAKGAKLTTRVKINVFIVAEKAMKIFESSGKAFQDILAVRDKYGVDKWCFEVKRHGAAKSTKTKYSILPERELSPDERKAADSAPLHNLEAVEDDEDDAASAAPPADPHTKIAPAVAAEFRERLRRLPKETAYYPLLGTFGCERLDEILAADEHKARTMIERAERGERIAPPPAPKNELDEFQ